MRGSAGQKAGIVLAVCAGLVSAFSTPPAVAGGHKGEIRKGPNGLAFYEPSTPLPGRVSGDVIWARRLSGKAALPSARRNVLVLYRSADRTGAPVAVSGTVALPRGKPRATDGP
jgi:hypothetical protein